MYNEQTHPNGITLPRSIPRTHAAVRIVQCDQKVKLPAINQADGPRCQLLLGHTGHCCEFAQRNRAERRDGQFRITALRAKLN
jgi:hypothetical protein